MEEVSLITGLCNYKNYNLHFAINLLGFLAMSIDLSELYFFRLIIRYFMVIKFLESSVLLICSF